MVFTESEPPKITKRQPYLIAVAGGTASGKTTVCKAIIEEIQHDPAVSEASVGILSSDYFYKELSPEMIKMANAGNFNFDHPHAFDFVLFREVLQKLLNGDPVVKVPQYCYVTHSRTGWIDFHNADVILVEGILVLYPKEIRCMYSMKIFVDCDADTRLARRIFRDMDHRGRTLENIIPQYTNHVKPAFEEFCLPTKKYVDIILPKGKENIVAISVISQHVMDLLNGVAKRPDLKLKDRNGSSGQMASMPNNNLSPNENALKVTRSRKNSENKRNETHVRLH